MTIYDRIKLRREELGMSQEDLAKLTGYTDRSSIAKIENGVNDITQSKVVTFAKALNTTPAYLMGWDETTAPISESGRSEIQTIFDSLTPDNQAKLLELSRLYLDAQHNSEEKK